MSDWVICFGGSPNQVPYIKEIRKLNFKVFLLDKNKDAPGKDFSNEFVPIGYDQFDKIKDFAKNNLLDSYKVKHVLVPAQFSQLGVSFISELLYLDFINKKVF